MGNLFFIKKERMVDGRQIQRGIRRRVGGGTTLSSGQRRKMQGAFLEPKAKKGENLQGSEACREKQGKLKVIKGLLGTKRGGGL